MSGDIQPAAPLLEGAGARPTASLLEAEPIPMADLAGMQAWAEALMASRPRDFAIGGDDDPYILRWWVIPRNRWSNTYLHDIRRSDDDRALHDHPWPNTSFLIFGSYIEHTPEGSFVRKAGDVVFRPANALHRLEVIPGERAISLFSTGPKEREWGFACPQGWVHYQDFTSADGMHVGRGCGEIDDPTPVTAIGAARGTAPQPAATVHGDWRLSLDEGVFYRGKQVSTARRTAWTRLLTRLAEAQGRVLSPAELLNLAPNVGAHLVQSQVNQLRKRMAAMGVPDPIVSVRRRGVNGYCWDAGE